MNSWLWYFNRATGIVALVLGAGALIFGFFFTARATGRKRRPNWWLDLHNWLGGAAMVFTVVHVAAVYLDKAQGVGVLKVLIPGTGSAGLTVGVIAMYLFAIAVLTSWPKRLFSRRTWRILHLLSIPGAVFAALHALWLGSDALNPVFSGVLIVLTALVIYPAVLRLYSVLSKGASRVRTAV